MNLLTQSIASSLLLAGSGLSASAGNPPATQPNVIIIYTDDQGAIDLNCFGATDLVTPNMDKLVKSGIKFTRFYGAPICSPSRAGLLTGKTPQRAGVPGNVSPRSLEAGMPGSQYTIAEMFKDAGYKTAHIGKWHLGHAKDKQPNAQGFDYSLVILWAVSTTIPIFSTGTVLTGTTCIAMERKYFTRASISLT